MNQNFYCLNFEKYFVCFILKHSNQKLPNITTLPPSVDYLCKINFHNSLRSMVQNLYDYE